MKTASDLHKDQFKRWASAGDLTSTIAQNLYPHPNRTMVAEVNQGGAP